MAKGHVRTSPLPVPGQIFTRWTVLEEVPIPQRWVGTYRAKYHWYRCVCLCSKQRVIDDNRLNGRTSKSCGCLRYHRIRNGIEWRKDAHHESAGTTTHAITKEYRAWRGMKERCLNTKGRHYAHYGGRGITIYPQWIVSYETFLQDVGRAPTLRHTLGRIDNNGPYAPNNVRWETVREQNLNTRRTTLLTFNGKTLPLAEWVKETGIPRQRLQMRLRSGYTVEQAMTLPRGKHRQKPRDR
jgi:hypothetical protein